ncbi:MAG: hypothetical protein EAX96_08990 [Candidatus Lokiarchaeota archaeon]|nr:hypothetical protein [Candidatus Lokiarchaeota archaeon]
MLQPYDFHSLIILNIFYLIIISLPILHIIHFRGNYKIPFPSIIRKFTRYEEFFMKLMFKILNLNFLYKYKSLRFIPEAISKLAGGIIQPSLYTLQELKATLNQIYKNNGDFSECYSAILLRPCPCRDAQRNYSTKLPNVTDVLFTTNKKEIKKNKNNIFITKEQLFKRLDYFDEMGLMHIVLGCMGQEGYGLNICNCHKSVCFVLKAVIGRGIQGGLKKSSKIAVVNAEKCKGIEDCGKCLTRCQFNAREARDNKGAVIEEICYGCGLCANSCPEKATTMIARKHYHPGYIPIMWLK